MNGLAVCSILGLLFYVLLCNWQLLEIFLYVSGAYLVLTYIYYPYGSQYNTLRKKVSIVTWSEPYGPEILSCLKVRFSNALALLDRLNSEGKAHLTPTHLVVKAVADTLSKFPNLNSKLVFGNIVPYPTVDVSCLVALDEGHDLGFLCFREADRKSASDLANEAKNRVVSARTGEERKKHTKAVGPFKLIPTCLGGILGEVTAWLVVTLGLDLSVFGLEKHPCGPAVITNIGTMGAEVIYAPFPTILKIPLILVMNTIQDDVVVEDGKLVVDKVLTLAITVDHRFIDGVHALAAQNHLKKVLEDPEKYLNI